MPKPLTAPADFLLEIGVEELPPGDVDSAQEQLEDMALTLFDDLRLKPQEGDSGIQHPPAVGGGGMANSAATVRRGTGGKRPASRTRL